MMAVLASFLIALAALLMLALAMAKHQRDLLHRELSARASRAWRIGGSLLLALSLAPSLARSGWDAGLALWCTACSMAGFVVVLMLIARRPKRARAGSTR